MLRSPNEIYVAAIASGALMCFLIAVITISIIRYQKRYRVHFREINELKNAYEQELLKAQLEIREQTLHSISQEIHDNVGQILSLAKLNLNKFLIAESPDNGRITQSKSLITKAIHDLRTISKSLNYDYIADQTLPQLLKNDIEAIKSATDSGVEFTLKGAEKSINPQHQLILYRIAQEAISNVIKHSAAMKIDVILEYSDESLKVTVKDNGIGFNPDEPKAPGGTGFYNMQNRAKLIGATFTFESVRGIGSTVQIVLPLDKIDG